MTFTNFGKPFRVAKEMHLFTLEVLIGACSKPGSFVVNFATSTNISCFNPFIIALDIHSKMSFNILFLASHNVLACWNLGRHILALDGD
jgi:hypothetical protein